MNSKIYRIDRIAVLALIPTLLFLSCGKTDNPEANKRDSKEHRYSTGFECLIGYLYLNNQQERIYEIFDEFKKRVNELENEEI